MLVIFVFESPKKKNKPKNDNQPQPLTCRRMRPSEIARSINNALLACIIIVQFLTILPLSLAVDSGERASSSSHGTTSLRCPHTFSLAFIASSRFDRTSHSYEGILHKPHADKWDIQAWFTDKSRQLNFKYHSGRLTLNNACYENVDAVPPTNILSDKFLTEAVRISPDTPVYDREVNTCIRQGMDTWLLRYYAGEPFILCTVPGHTLKHNSNDNNHQLRGFDVPVRLIGANLLVDFSKFRPFPTPSLDLLFSHSLPINRCVENQVIDTYNTGYDKKKKDRGDNQSLDLWFSNTKQACSLHWIKDDETCRLYANQYDETPPQEASKVCVFLHGVGQSEADKGEPTNTFTEYWGKVHEYTPQCKERIFIREETKLRGWDSEELQRSYCNISLWGQGEEETIIKDKILFVHSMGNLILSGAIRNGFCDVDIESTSWYHIQGPFLGSKASNTLSDICMVLADGLLPEWTQIYKLYKWIAEEGGYCVPGSNQSYPAYHTLDPQYEPLHDLYKIPQSRVKGSLCGVSAVGLYSIYSPMLKVLSAFVGYGDWNDGMVPFTSCSKAVIGGEDIYEPDYHSHYYVGFLNHADGTCRDGDGMWGLHRMPCSWYLNKE